jgi:ubiquinone/menaquinone biosynthesis C-methylase UbiE
MSVREAFDRWAESGRDRGMEAEHWHTAKHALARMPIEGGARGAPESASGERSDPRAPGDTVLDLGTGSGYALRALDGAHRLDRGIGLDASPEMVDSAREYTAADHIDYLVGDFHRLPVADGSVDHVWSMEAFFFARDPVQVLAEVRRVLRPGGTFYCAVNFYEESEGSHRWQERIDLPMTLWSRAEYRELFREAGLSVAAQDTIPDREIDIPPAAAFPTDEWETRTAMVDRYRTWGTLLTVGVAP